MYATKHYQSVKRPDRVAPYRVLKPKTYYFKENIWATFFTFNWWISIWETNIKLGWHAKFDDLENCFFLYLISLIQYCAKVMQTIIDEYREYRDISAIYWRYLTRFYLKRYIQRYIVRAIVLFLGEISFLLCNISFQLCDISFPLRDISSLLCDISF